MLNKDVTLNNYKNFKNIFMSPKSIFKHFKVKGFSINPFKTKAANNEETVLTESELIKNDSNNQSKDSFQKFKTKAFEKIENNELAIEGLKSKFEDRLTILERINTNLKTKLENFKEVEKDKRKLFTQKFNNEMQSLLKEIEIGI